jgi:ABC-type spermidine/putrescine transport system permease subunit II
MEIPSESFLRHYLTNNGTLVPKKGIIMFRIRIILYIPLLVATLFTLFGCETNVGTNYTTRWFYKSPEDPYKSRASGATSSHGFTSFKESENK